MEAIELLECGHIPSPHGAHTTGYGTDADGNRHCYDCCAEYDREQMRKDGKAVLYLTLGADGGGYCVTNWPSSLAIPCMAHSIGRHNFAGKRYDVWFYFEKTLWHGVQYGDNTQLCHCKRLKGKRK